MTASKCRMGVSSKLWGMALQSVYVGFSERVAHVTREIQLTQGRVALVDDADFDWLNQWKWCVNGRGYVGRKDQDRYVSMHRLIMGAPSGLQIDHKNLSKLDNQRCNLRLATGGQNSSNQPKKAGKTSQYKGVYFIPTTHRWQVQIRVNRRLMHLGVFANEIDAALAYDAAARKHFGVYARCNFAAEQNETTNAANVDRF